MGAALSPRFGKGFSYADCWVDDASLVVLNAMDTRERGAQIRTRTRFVSARRAGAVWSAEIDGPQGARQTVQASMLVNAAGPWVVLANFEQILSDPAFWRALTNNLWFALGTIPVSIALALLMPIWVNGRLPGRTFARWPISPPPSCR